MKHRDELIELLGLVHEMRKIQSKLPKQEEDNETRAIIVRSMELETKVDFTVKRIASELKREEIERFVNNPFNMVNSANPQPYDNNINSI